jgi:hypothetical protein
MRNDKDILLPLQLHDDGLKPHNHIAVRFTTCEVSSNSALSLPPSIQLTSIAVVELVVITTFGVFREFLLKTSQ